MADSLDRAAPLLTQLAACAAAGKHNATADLPPGTAGRPGVEELVAQGLAAGVSPRAMLNEGLLAGMQDIGGRFTAGEAYIPEVLIAARAMKLGLNLLRPALTADPVAPRGHVILGTVHGDLHDIGKQLVGIMLTGAGWEIEDLGIDCPTEKFVAALDRRPDAVVGLSALLTTTMLNMRTTVVALRSRHPDAIILVGGAPVNAAFAEEIGATGYAPDPLAAIALLDRLRPRAG